MANFENFENGNSSNQFNFTNREQLLSGLRELPSNRTFDASLQIGKSGELSFGPLAVNDANQLSSKPGDSITDEHLQVPNLWDSATINSKPEATSTRADHRPDHGHGDHHKHGEDHRHHQHDKHDKHDGPHHPSPEHSSSSSSASGSGSKDITSTQAESAGSPDNTSSNPATSAGSTDNTSSNPVASGAADSTPTTNSAGTAAAGLSNELSLPGKAPKTTGNTFGPTAAEGSISVNDATGTVTQTTSAGDLMFYKGNPDNPQDNTVTWDNNVTTNFNGVHALEMGTVNVRSYSGQDYKNEAEVQLKNIDAETGTATASFFNNTLPGNGGWDFAETVTGLHSGTNNIEMTEKFDNGNIDITSFTINGVAQKLPQEFGAGKLSASQAQSWLNLGLDDHPQVDSNGSTSVVAWQSYVGES